MKIVYYSLFLGLTVLLSCKNNVEQAQEKVSFDIYETLIQKNVPLHLVKELEQMNVEPDFDSLSPIIAYVHKDSTLRLSAISSENISFLKTAYTVDEDTKYYAIVAVKKRSALTNKDIKKTKPNQNNIVVFMNLQGANKWADLTKRNIGKMIAIAVDNQIYTLTSINSEIRNGLAIIGKIKTEEQAIEISNSLNGQNN